jgi:hypothetical protein
MLMTTTKNIYNALIFIGIKFFGLQLQAQQQSFMIPFCRNMSKLTINSTLRMNSGYEIPMLGYGIYLPPYPYHRDSNP